MEVEVFNNLIGRTVVEIKGGIESDHLVLYLDNGCTFEMWHDQECCEDVFLNDVAGGDLGDLLSSQILEAYASSEEATEFPDDQDHYSGTWTFYTFRTMSHTLTLRWLGLSNGYYSEEVTHAYIPPQHKMMEA